MTTSAPYITEAQEAAWRRQVKREYRECRQQNPKLMRRLRRLSDDQLLRLNVAVLELLPSTPEYDYELRLLRDLAFFRAAPRPGRVPRKHRPPESQPAPEQARPQALAHPALGGLTPPENTLPVDSPALPALPAPAAVRPPDNVIRAHFGPVFFNNGRVSPRWLGGEV